MHPQMAVFEISLENTLCPLGIKAFLDIIKSV